MIGPKTTLTLKQITSSGDSVGGWTETEATIKSIKGVLSTIRGNERLSADKKTVIADYYFYMDYPKGFTVTEEDLFYFDTRKFKIIYINDMGANQNNRYKITLKEET
ncbi:hypothetical protein ES708_19716 [subsurface metagenome]